MKDNITNALSTLKDEKYFASLKYLYSGIIQMIGSKGFKVIGGGRYMRRGSLTPDKSEK